jgi:hypothetical protein
MGADNCAAIVLGMTGQRDEAAKRCLEKIIWLSSDPLAF